ncbi:MAG TPA: deoxyribose-phosphate aldolase, partial [Actinomycetota bacterium]
VLQAAELAMRAGADFLKTSTGKTRMGATPAAARVVMEAIRDHHADGGRRVGFKAAGGIRTPDQALEYVRLCREVLGGPWTTPDLFRIGASGLLDQLVQD